MKENIHVILITVALLGGGLLTGIWTQKTRLLPPPPMAPWGEFQSPGAGHHTTGQGNFQPMQSTPDRFNPQHQQMRESLEEKMQALQPEINAFQKNMQIIQESFHQKLMTILNAEQKQKIQAAETQRPKSHPQQMEGRPSSGHPDFQRGGPMPSGAPHPSPGEDNPILGMVIVKATLDEMTEALKLDSKQQAELKPLLVERRTQLLALLDKTPPPTIKLEKMLRQTSGSGPLPRPGQSSMQGQPQHPPRMGQ